MNIEGDQFHEMIISLCKTCSVSHFGVVGFLRAVFDHEHYIYGMTRESKMMEHQGSHLMWG